MVACWLDSIHRFSSLLISFCLPWWRCVYLIISWRSPWALSGGGRRGRACIYLPVETLWRNVAFARSSCTFRRCYACCAFFLPGPVKYFAANILSLHFCWRLVRGREVCVEWTRAVLSAASCCGSGGRTDRRGDADSRRKDMAWRAEDDMRGASAWRRV